MRGLPWRHLGCNSAGDALRHLVEEPWSLILHSLKLPWECWTLGPFCRCQRGRETQAAKTGSCPHAQNSVAMVGEFRQPRDLGHQGCSWPH